MVLNPVTMGANALALNPEGAKTSLPPYVKASVEPAPKKRSFWALLGFGAVTACAAILGGSVGRKRARTWYRFLRKPSFAPRATVFGPVWSALYALMTVSATRVYRAPPSKARTIALGLWGAQLALNAAWMPLFFGAKRPRLALVDGALLGLAVDAYTIAAAKVDRPAAAMMAPYLAWLTYAGALHTRVIQKNPWIHG